MKHVVVKHKKASKSYVEYYEELALVNNGYKLINFYEELPKKVESLRY